MKVGIIGGTGGMGKGFALRWSQNHDVIISTDINIKNNVENIKNFVK